MRRPRIDLKHSLVMEVTADPNFFGFCFPGLESFTSVGISIEDCLYETRWGIEEHLALLGERGLPIPFSTTDPKVTNQIGRPPNPAGH